MGRGAGGCLSRLCDAGATGVGAERGTILTLGGCPAAPLRGAVPAWRPAFPCGRPRFLARGRLSRRPAARGCAGLEAGVPLRSPAFLGSREAVPTPRCAGLCRSGDRRSLAVARVSWLAGGCPAVPPPAGLCRPGDRRSLACVRWGCGVCSREKMAANFVRCRRDRGESVKGGHPPFHKKVTTNRNSPKRAPAREGVAVRGAKRRAVRGWGLLSPAPS